MKVRRKLRQLPSSLLRSFGLALQTSLSSSTTKIIFLSSLILCHLLGFTLCIGKLNFVVFVVAVIYFVSFFCFRIFFSSLYSIYFWVCRYCEYKSNIFVSMFFICIFSSCFHSMHIIPLNDLHDLGECICIEAVKQTPEII